MADDGPLKMADVARLAKVSMSTVSRALADNPLIPEDRQPRDPAHCGGSWLCHQSIGAFAAHAQNPDDWCGVSTRP